MCRVAWSAKYNFLCIDMTKKEVKYRIFNECKTAYIDCIPQSELF